MKLIQTIKSWYTKDENGRTNRPAAIIFFACLTLPLVIFEGIKVGLYDKYSRTADIGIVRYLNGLSMPFGDILKLGKQTTIQTNRDWSADFLIILLLLWALIFALSWVSADRMRRLINPISISFGKIKDYVKKYAYPLDKEGFCEPAEPTADEPGNMILSQNVRYNLAGTSFPNNTYSCAFIVGSTGSGKSFNYVKPNIMQMNSSYVITDPKGELLRDCGKMLADNGYDVLVFNLKKGEQCFSCRYNPFEYIRSEQDVILAVDAFLDATTDKGSGGDPFFPIAEKNFYYALFFYVFSSLPKEQRTLKSVYELYASANEQETQKGKAPSISDFDRKFDEIGQKDPYNASLPFYNTFKKGSPKTKQSILISVGIKLWFLSVPETANLLSGDDLHFNTLAERKTALFVCIPTDNNSFQCLSAMLFSQLFQELYYQGETLNARTFLLKKGNYTAGRSRQFVEGIGEDKARAELEARQAVFKDKAKIYYELDLAKNDEELNRYLSTPIEAEIGITPFPKWIVTDNLDKTKATIYETFRSEAAAKAYLDAGQNGSIVRVSGLAVRTRFILDEFYAIGKIQGFEAKIATFRSLKISADIIVQNLEQLKEMYDDKEGKVTGNCDVKICLGLNTLEDAKLFSEMCGKKHGTQESTSIKRNGLAPSSDGGNISETDTELVPAAWLLNEMKGNELLILTRTAHPIKDVKYNTLADPRWSLLYNDKKPDESLRFPTRRIFFIEQKRENCIKTVLQPLDLAKAISDNQSVPGDYKPADPSFKKANNITSREEIIRQIKERHMRAMEAERNEAFTEDFMDDVKTAEEKNTLVFTEDGDIPINTLSTAMKERMKAGIQSGELTTDKKNPNRIVSKKYDIMDALSDLTDKM